MNALRTLSLCGLFLAAGSSCTKTNHPRPGGIIERSHASASPGHTRLVEKFAPFADSRPLLAELDMPQITFEEEKAIEFSINTSTPSHVVAFMVLSDRRTIQLYPNAINDSALLSEKKLSPLKARKVKMRSGPPFGTTSLYLIAFKDATLPDGRPNPFIVYSESIAKSTLERNQLFPTPSSNEFLGLALKTLTELKPSGQRNTVDYRLFNTIPKPQPDTPSATEPNEDSAAP